MENSPRSVGISTKYLPTVLGVDMLYDGSGLVASRYPISIEAKEQRGQAAPDEKSADGEAVLSELTTRGTYAEDAPLLGDIDEWNYPIFQLACQTGGRVVSTLICQLFEDNNLFKDLCIPREKFSAYFQALENGYKDNPYHNRIHAADVLQSMAYLLNTDILGLNVLYSQSDDTKSVAGHNVAKEYSHADLRSAIRDAEKKTPGCSSCALKDALSPLELAACFISAAQHDFDHPARTNSFLVSTKADLAILYNDRAVLEQHHAAASWKLLFDNPDYNFLCNMSTTDVRILRNLTLELILATDLAKHFDIIRQFKNLTRDPTFLKAREDRLSIMQMCIKLADINGATKCGALHRKWAYLICEEFYDQGMEEVSYDLPISPYMDKHNPLVPKLQLSFIGTLLRPLLTAFAEAGFLPGPYELVEDSESPPGTPDSQQSNLGRLHNNLVSMIVQNTTNNEIYWNNVLRLEDEKRQAALEAADTSSTHPNTSSAANG